MKKIKFLVVTLILIFCFTTKKSLNSNAEKNIIQLYDGETIQENTAFVLNSGCYFFGCEGPQISVENITGDYGYYYQEPGFEHLEFHMISDELEIENDELFFDAENKFLERYTIDGVIAYGVHVVYVRSYGVFFTDTELTDIFCYGGLSTAPNTNCNIAGNMTHIVDYDNPTSFSEIKARYRATDNVDGDITSKLLFETNYNENHLKIGSYYIIMYVTDSSNHTTYAADIIKVKDFTPPTITLSKSEHVIEVHTSFTFEEAKKFFTVQDNSTPQNLIQLRFKDEYNNQYNKVGTYKITATATDKDNNSSVSTLTIRVVDTTKPNISLLAGGTTIYANHVLSDSEIRALLHVTDNYSTLSNSQIQIVENTCTGQQGRNYVLRVSVTDENNNVGEQTFNYYLLDTESPVIMVEKTIYIPLGSNYTNEQIIQMLKEVGVLNLNAVNVYLNTDEITTDKEGNYDITYTEVYSDGSTKEGKLKLSVVAPVEGTVEENVSNTASWYLLLLLLPLVLAILFVIIKKHKHEKE